MARSQLKLVAKKAPKLYRKYTNLLDNMYEAKAYYHGTNIDNIPDIDTLTDEELPSLFDMPDSRQGNSHNIWTYTTGKR